VIHSTFEREPWSEPLARSEGKAISERIQQSLGHPLRRTWSRKAHVGRQVHGKYQTFLDES
jgi:hypothetical protein